MFVHVSCVFFKFFLNFLEQLKETTRFCSKIEWSTREKITHIRFPSPNLLTGFLYFFFVSDSTQDIHIHLNCIQSSFKKGEVFVHVSCVFFKFFLNFLEQLKETTRFCSKIEWSTREKITHIRFPSPNLLTGFLYFFFVSDSTQDIHIHLDCIQSSFMYGKPKSHSFIHMQISFLSLIFEWKFYWCKIILS